MQNGVHLPGDIEGGLNAPPSGNPPIEPEPRLEPIETQPGPTSEPMSDAAPVPPSRVAVSYNQLVKLYNAAESEGYIQPWWLANVAIKWLIETNQGNYEEMFCPRRCVIDLTHKDPFMIGSIDRSNDGKY